MNNNLVTERHKTEQINLPLQLVMLLESGTYPARQSHRNDPSVFWQNVVLKSQSSVKARHSSISARIMNDRVKGWERLVVRYG